MMPVPPPDGGPTPGRALERGEHDAVLQLLRRYNAFHARLQLSLSTVSRLALSHRSEDPLRMQVVVDFLGGPLPEHLDDEERTLFPALASLAPPHEVSTAIDQLRDGARLARTTISAMMPALLDLAAGRPLLEPDLLELRMHVQALLAVLATHLELEENLLFPWLRGLPREGG